jgi:DNA-binding protein
MKKNTNYERWEVCISGKQNINNYVGYVKAQFHDDQRKFVVVKARGYAIENALKVVQLIKENLGGIHSCTRFYLMTGGHKNEEEEDEGEEIKGQFNDGNSENEQRSNIV